MDNNPTQLDRIQNTKYQNTKKYKNTKVHRYKYIIEKSGRSPLVNNNRRQLDRIQSRHLSNSSHNASN